MGCAWGYFNANDGRQESARVLIWRAIHGSIEARAPGATAGIGLIDGLQHGAFCKHAGALC